MDLLALDWFSENTINLDLRLYLIDKLLPTLVLGMEKVSRYNSILSVSNFITICTMRNLNSNYE